MVDPEAQPSWRIAGEQFGHKVVGAWCQSQGTTFRLISARREEVRVICPAAVRRTAEIKVDVSGVGPVDRKGIVPGR